MSVALSVDIHAKVETVVCKAIRRSLPVIASEAKQSIERHVGKRALRKKAGLLRGACHRAALRADPLARNDGGTHLRDLAARFARGFSGSFRPLQSEGAGNAGRPMRPIAARAMVVVERTRVSQVTPAKHPAFPAQWFYGLLRALPGDRAFLSPSPLRSLLLTSLTPASRRQNHTTSPSASGALVSSAIRVHRILSRVRDDLEPPLCGTGREKL